MKKKPAVYAKRRWRVYFTCRAQWPNSAAIDQGTIETMGVPTRSNTDVGRPGVQLVKAGWKGEIKRRDRRDRENEPTWWIEAHGVLEVAGDRGRIRP